MKIGLLSDTHGYLHERIFHHFAGVDEIWHAGDIGNVGLYDRLSAFKPTRAVYGNIDGADVRRVCPENLIWNCNGLKIFMTHIGGYPGRYNGEALKIIRQEKPGLFICGHSHILRIMPDTTHGLLHINPGAAGVHGWHKVLTLVRFSVENGKIKSPEVIELGARGKLTVVD